MNKLFTKIASIAVGALMAIGVGVAVGQKSEVRVVEAAASYTFSGNTVTFANQGLSNGVAYTDQPFTNGVFNVQFASGGNNGKYYNTGSAIRVYGGGTFSVSAVSGNLSSVVLTFGSGEDSNTITANVGTYSAGSWTGSASSITFSIGGSSGHRRIATVTATLEATGDHTISTSTVGLYLTGDTSVSDGDGAEVTLSTVQKKKIKSVSVTGAGEEDVNWSYSNKTLIILEVTGDVSVSAVLEDASIGSISVTGQKTTFIVGDSFSFGGTVVGTYDDDASPHGTETINESNYSVNSSAFNSSVAGQYTIIVTVEEATFNYNVTVKNATGALSSGRYYIFSANGALENKNYSNSTSTKVNIYSTSAWVFTLVDDDTYTISNGSEYLYSTNDNSGLRSKVAATNWTLTALTGGDAGKYSLTTVDASSNVRYLCDFNGAKNDWRTYKEASIGDMYKLSIVEEQTAFANYLTTNFTCSGVTVQNPNGAITAENPSTVWSNLSTFKTNLSSAAQNTLKTLPANESGTAVEAALARYDLVIRKYTTSSYVDFLGRFSSGGANATALILGATQSAELNSSALVIVIVSIISAVAIGGYFFLRKRKEQ